MIFLSFEFEILAQQTICSLGKGTCCVFINLRMNLLLFSPRDIVKCSNSFLKNRSSNCWEVLEINHRSLNKNYQLTLYLNLLSTFHAFFIFKNPLLHPSESIPFYTKMLVKHLIVAQHSNINNHRPARNNIQHSPSLLGIICCFISFKLI
jgi:hypothetical protein